MQDEPDTNDARPVYTRPELVELAAERADGKTYVSLVEEGSMAGPS